MAAWDVTNNIGSHAQKYIALFYSSEQSHVKTTVGFFLNSMSMASFCSRRECRSDKYLEMAKVLSGKPKSIIGNDVLSTFFN